METKQILELVTQTKKEMAFQGVQVRCYRVPSHVESEGDGVHLEVICQRWDKKMTVFAGGHLVENCQKLLGEAGFNLNSVCLEKKPNPLFGDRKQNSIVFLFVHKE